VCKSGESKSAGFSQVWPPGFNIVLQLITQGNWVSLLRILTVKRVGGVAQAVRHLPSKHKALS
jgi:hypothetical protein